MPLDFHTFVETSFRRSTNQGGNLTCTVPGTRGPVFLMDYFAKVMTPTSYMKGLRFVGNRNLTGKTTAPQYISIELNHAGQFFTKKLT